LIELKKATSRHNNPAWQRH